MVAEPADVPKMLMHAWHWSGSLLIHRIDDPAIFLGCSCQEWEHALNDLALFMHIVSILDVDVQMITHSRALPIVLLIDMFALLSYNFAGMCVTGETLCFALL